MRAGILSRENGRAGAVIPIILTLMSAPDHDDENDEHDALGPLEELLDRGWERLRKNDLDGARRIAEEASALDPSAGEPWTLLGAAAAAGGDNDAAMEHYGKASRLAPDDISPVIYQAEILLFDRHEYDEALELCEHALDLAETEEEFLDAVLLKAEINVGKEDIPAAEAALDQLPPTPFPDAELEVRAGRCFFDLQHLEEAEDHFQRAIQVDAKSGDGYHGLGMVYEEQEDTRAMVKAWLRVRELDLELPAVAWALEQSEFEQIAEEALEELPERIRTLLANVPIVAADYPSIEIVAEGNDPRMMGFFSGVPYPEKTTLGGAPHLDCVFLYRLNIERMAKNRAETIHEIKITLLHETGHFFGLSEEELAEMGLG
jgi:predicted Zn-dependent protease with MMP-like domain/Tfp pilus assembly protein PilF